MTRRTANSPLEVLDRDPLEWRSALDSRYAVLEEALAGRRRAVIYPAARMGRAAAQRLRSMGVEPVAFGDGDPALHGTVIDGVPVLSPVEISARHRSDVILVASTLHDSTIRERLHERGCRYVVPVGYLNLRLPDVFAVREYDGAWAAAADPSNRSDIVAAYSLLADDQSRDTFEGKLRYYLSLDKSCLDAIRTKARMYFDRSVYSLRDDENVVDGGAFVGDTLSSFLDVSKGRFRAYTAFEPDETSFHQLQATAGADRSRITVVRAALASRSQRAWLLSTHGADSRLLADGESGGEAVAAVSLDEHFEDRPAPSVVKMDIEGAEAAALAGASGVIANSTPVLAISAYHVASDLWTIPPLLASMMPGSSLYLRHYTREVDDTVCYAVPAQRVG